MIIGKQGLEVSRIQVVPSKERTVNRLKSLENTTVDLEGLVSASETGHTSANFPGSRLWRGFYFVSVVKFLSLRCSLFCHDHQLKHASGATGIRGEQLK